MAQFNAYPASQVRAPDVWGAMQRGAEGAQKNQLRQMKIGQMQADRGRLNQLREIMPGVGAEAGLGPSARQALAIDPSQLSALLKIPKAKRDQAKAEIERVGNLLQAVETSPPVQRPTMYAMVRQQYAASGADMSNIPETYDPAWAQTKLAEAGKLMAVLDQAEKAEPAGYRSTEGGLEFTPGGPADPAQVGRLASAKSKGGGLTVAQRRENAEIQQARKALDREGLSHEDVMRISKSQKDTGRDNPEYSPFINSRVRQATRRKYGDDPEYVVTYGRYLTPSPEFSDPAGMRPLPPGVSAEQPGILDRVGDFLFGGDDMPAPAPGGAPRRGTPRAGGRGGPSGRRGAKAIPKMSLAEIDDLVNTRGDSLSPAELKAVQARLSELGM